MSQRDHDDDLTHGLYLQNSPGNVGDLATPSMGLEYAVAAEEAGWDGVFLADALGPDQQSFYDPWVTLSAIAARTDTIRLGTWITPLPRRQPWQVASDLAALDRLSDGRVLFGVGLGAPWNYEATGMGYDPRELGERYDEALDVVLELWTGESVTYRGEYVEVEDLQLAVTPVQKPRIPVVMGTWWPNKKPLQRAAAYDGIMPVGPSFYGTEGVQGEEPTGSIEEETEAMLRYYREEACGEGEIVIPIDVPEAPPDFLETCRDLGATWTLTTSLFEADDHEGNLERIREGPPA